MSAPAVDLVLESRLAVLRQQIREHAAELDLPLLDKLARILAWSASWLGLQDDRAPRWATTAAAELRELQAQRGDALQAYQLRMIRNALAIGDRLAELDCPPVALPVLQDAVVI